MISQGLTQMKIFGIVNLLWAENMQLPVADRLFVYTWDSDKTNTDVKDIA
jgi:hypothetical protein